jgi:probable HAF family extracellular repeat protein
VSRRPLLVTCTAFLSLACAGEPTVPDATTDAPDLAALHDAPLTFFPLPADGYVYSDAYGVSANGWVAGEIDLPTGEWHAARWKVRMGAGGPSATPVEDLGALNGRYTLAFDVNNAGVTVGGSVEAAYGFGPGPDEAFVHRDGVTHILPSLGGAGGFARRINNRDWIAGYSDTESGERHATVWRPGPDGAYTAIDLGTLGGTFSWANNILDDGRVVGLSETADGAIVAWTWSGRGPLQPLSSLTEGGANFAVDQNTSGFIVGNATDAAFYNRAVSWRRGTITDFSHLFPAEFPYTNPAAVNAFEWIVTVAFPEDFSTVRAFLSRGSLVTDLAQAAGSTGFTDALDVNVRGWVAGGAELDGIVSAGLWLPSHERMNVRAPAARSTAERTAGRTSLLQHLRDPARALGVPRQALRHQP